MPILRFHQNLKLKTFIVSKLANFLSNFFIFRFIETRQFGIRRGTIFLASLVRCRMRGTNLMPIWLNVPKKSVMNFMCSSSVRDSPCATTFALHASDKLVIVVNAC